MELILEIVSAEKYTLGGNARKIFSPAGGTVGRAADCDWSIVDGTRRLSGRHAYISFSKGQFVVTDTSTNGVFINEAEYPLGRDASYVVKDGDRLIMGALEISVFLRPGPFEQENPLAETKGAFKEDLVQSVVDGIVDSIVDSPFDIVSLNHDPFGLDTPLDETSPRAPLVSELLHAAGLSQNEYDKHGDTLLHLIGTVFKESITGLQKTLRTRAALKNEFRLAMTMVNIEENNPLKFSSNYKQTVRLALDKEQGYMPLGDAVKEGFQDLQEHQVAVMAGVKSALDYMMRRMDPDEIENKVDQNQDKLRFFYGKKNCCWDSFQQLYNDLIDDDDVFRSFFSEPFERAYQQHLKEIKLNSSS